MNVKIISWNIWFGTYLDNVKNFLKHENADIISLQEVTQTPKGENNIAKYLANELGYNYVYATGMDLRNFGKEMVMGNAVLSKYPILSSKIYKLSKNASHVAIQGDIQLNNTVYHIVSTHLMHTHLKPSDIQEEEAKTLISVLPKERMIVMGDFNATPDSNAIKIMRNSLHQVDDNGIEPTWCLYPDGCKECHTNGVTIRFDYMFATDDVLVKKFVVENSDGSDHLPISANIEI